MRPLPDGLAPPPHYPPPPPAGGGSSSRAAAGRSGGGPSTSTSSSGGGGFAPIYLQQQGTAAPAAFQPPWAYAMGSPYPAGPQPPPAAAAAASSEPPGKHARPYDMPSTAAFNNPWAGGGPVGTGTTPLDVEAQVLYSFAEKEVRNGFQAKVFGIVALQLAITVAFSFVCLLVAPLKAYVRSNPWPFYLSWGLSFGLLLFISCSERLRRRWPINMLLLTLFTLFQAFLVGMITSFFDIEAVMLAFLTTCVAVTVLALIASQGSVDITSWGALLMVPSILILMLVFIGIFWIQRWLYLIIAGAAALLACVYLVYDLQLIMGGKSYQISPDEWVFAALSLYLDISQIFIWTLALIGIGRQ